ncbi:unnamed protein product [Sphenostylis stenocarpa]|uniref:Casein kinase II subunit beta n=1 Tax=Sphenostylis stenocarpa TaxID=92480 RepID=A0AA86S8T2_9FABA|nr:unnamed protein product [Sphenostylis stenocarpa]
MDTVLKSTGQEEHELNESAAEMLYGLIHGRFILPNKGMAALMSKSYCSGQPCLLVGQSDTPRSSKVKIYGSKCEDIYHPKSKYQDIRANFGVTFPHLFLMTFGNLKPQKPSQNYIPRVFGFKVHMS